MSNNVVAGGVVDVVNPLEARIGKVRVPIDDDYFVFASSTNTDFDLAVGIRVAGGSRQSSHADDEAIVAAAAAQRVQSSFAVEEDGSRECRCIENIDRGTTIQCRCLDGTQLVRLHGWHADLQRCGCEDHVFVTTLHNTIHAGPTVDLIASEPTGKRVVSSASKQNVIAF